MQGHKRAYRLAVMSNLKDRIKSARAHAGLTQLELAKKVGVSQPVISQLEKGENLQSVHLVKIANACSVDAAWLAEGVGEMIPGGPDSITAKPGESSAEIVRRMLERNGRNLPAETRDRIMSALEAGSDQSTPANNVITGDFRRASLVGDEIRIAHYDVQGAMGTGKLVHDFPEMFRDVTVSQQHLKELGVTYKDPAHLKLITGDGQSMEPTIQDKDPLIADASIREFSGDGIYAFVWQGLFYIKRLQMKDSDHFKMISDNKHHDPEIIRIDETYIQARILLVWNAQKL